MAIESVVVNGEFKSTADYGKKLKGSLNDGGQSHALDPRPWPLDHSPYLKGANLTAANDFYSRFYSANDHGRKI